MLRSTSPQSARAAPGRMLRTAALLGGFTLVSRLLGLARDMGMAWLLGGEAGGGDGGGAEDMWPADIHNRPPFPPKRHSSEIRALVSPVYRMRLVCW